MLSSWLGWIESNAPQSQVRIRTDSNRLMFTYAQMGAGICPTPMKLGDSMPELVRITGCVDVLGLDIWLLTHADLRRSAKVQAFMDFMHEPMRRAFHVEDLYRSDWP